MTQLTRSPSNPVRLNAGFSSEGVTGPLLLVHSNWGTVPDAQPGRVALQPASRYWTFRSYETGIFLALALILTGVSFWWIRRRLA